MVSGRALAHATRETPKAPKHKTPLARETIGTVLPGCRSFRICPKAPSPWRSKRCPPKSTLEDFGWSRIGARVRVYERKDRVNISAESRSHLEPNAISSAIGYAKFFSRSQDAVIRVYDKAGSVIPKLSSK